MHDLTRTISKKFLKVIVRTPVVKELATSSHTKLQHSLLQADKTDMRWFLSGKSRTYMGPVHLQILRHGFNPVFKKR